MNEELDPVLIPEPDPIPVPDPVPDPTPPPVLELPPEEEPAAEPVEVISVDELLERLTQEENTELELPTEEAGMADVPVAADPYTVLIEQVIGKIVEVGIDLGKIERHTKEIQKEVTVVAQAVDHPALTTSFADYTVTEALLLFLLLAAFLSACARMLRGGLLWLRS